MDQPLREQTILDAPIYPERSDQYSCERKADDIGVDDRHVNELRAVLPKRWRPPGLACVGYRGQPVSLIVGNALSDPTAGLKPVILPAALVPTV